MIRWFAIALCSCVLLAALAVVAVNADGDMAPGNQEAPTVSKIAELGSPLESKRGAPVAPSGLIQSWANHPELSLPVLNPVPVQKSPQPGLLMGALTSSEVGQTVDELLQVQPQFEKSIPIRRGQVEYVEPDDKPMVPCLDETNRFRERVGENAGNVSFGPCEPVAAEAPVAQLDTGYGIGAVAKTSHHELNVNDPEPREGQAKSNSASVGKITNPMKGMSFALLVSGKPDVLPTEISQRRFGGKMVQVVEEVPASEIRIYAESFQLGDGRQPTDDDLQASGTTDEDAEVQEQQGEADPPAGFEINCDGPVVVMMRIGKIRGKDLRYSDGKFTISSAIIENPDAVITAGDEINFPFEVGSIHVIPVGRRDLASGASGVGDEGTPTPAWTRSVGRHSRQ